MTAKDAIEQQIVRKGISDPEVYRGNDHDAPGMSRHGWWYRPTDRRPIFLGASLAEALEMLARMG